MRELTVVIALLVSLTPAFGVSPTKRITYHGKPMFMIGVYAHPAGAANKAVLDDLASRGVTTAALVGRVLPSGGHLLRVRLFASSGKG